LESIIAKKLKFYTHSDRSSALFGNEIFSARRCAGGRRCSAAGVNLGPPHISETTGARKLDFYIHLHKSSALFKNDIFRQEKCGVAVPQRKFGTPSYLGTIGARKLRFYTCLDNVCSFSV